MSANILLVDDDPDFVALLRTALRGKGYTVATANNVRDGLTLTRTSPVDLILLDVMMPGQDGGVLAQTIKQDARLAEIPVIFLTALVSPAEAQKRAALGDRELYISKPVNLPELMACMEHQLAVARVRAVFRPAATDGRKSPER